MTDDMSMARRSTSRDEPRLQGRPLWQQSGRDSVELRLRENVAFRFERLVGIPVCVWLVRSMEDTRVETADSPCAACDEAAECRLVSLARLTALATRRQPQRRRCTRGHLRGMVPVIEEDVPVACCEFVCPASMPETDFDRHLELLEVLVESLTESNTDTPRHEPARQRTLQGKSTHPQVQQAIHYIEDHLSDPGLSVSGVARLLSLNATYMSHIFALEMGTRMSRYIARRRVQVAKHLLIDTEWQVKRIAFETGHLNADWFSQVFHTHAGMTPCEYRRRFGELPTRRR